MSTRERVDEKMSNLTRSLRNWNFRTQCCGGKASSTQKGKKQKQNENLNLAKPPVETSFPNSITVHDLSRMNKIHSLIILQIQTFFQKSP